MLNRIILIYQFKIQFYSGLLSRVGRDLLLVAIVDLDQVLPEAGSHVVHGDDLWDLK